MKVVGFVLVACVLNGCIQDSDTSSAVSGPLSLSAASMQPVVVGERPGPAEPGSSVVQREEARWYADVRGDTCYMGGPVNDCCNGDLRPVNDLFAPRFTVSPETYGAPFRVQFESVGVRLHGGVSFFDDSRRLLDQVIGREDVSPMWARGKVPEGAKYGVFWSCLSGPLRAVYEAESLDPVAGLRHGVDAWLAAGASPACQGSQLFSRGDRLGDDLTHVLFAIPAATRGREFWVGSMDLVDTVAPGIMLTFFDAQGRSIRVVRGHGPLAGNLAVGSGNVPDGAAFGDIWSCVNGPAWVSYGAGQDS